MTKEGIDDKRTIEKARGLAERMRGEAISNDPHRQALNKLLHDTRLLREEFIRHLSIDSRAPRTGYDMRMLVDSPKVVRHVSRLVLRAAVGGAHMLGTGAAFGTAKFLKEWIAPVVGLADPFSMAILLFATTGASVGFTRLGTGRWRDAIESSVIVDRVFENSKELASLRERIAAEPGNVDAVFGEFIRKHEYSTIRKIATGMISHGPAMLLGAWAYDAGPGAFAKTWADILKPGTWAEKLLIAHWSV